MKTTINEMEERHNKEILQVAELFQKDCHNTINEILGDKKMSYQDITNAWMFAKLAELEVRLRQLESIK